MLADGSGAYLTTGQLCVASREPLVDAQLRLSLAAASFVLCKLLGISCRGPVVPSYRGCEYRGVQLGVAGRSTARVLPADHGLQQLVATLHCVSTCSSAFSQHTHIYTCMPVFLLSTHRADA